MSRNAAQEAVFVDSSALRYINGIQSTKCVLLIDTSSSIYMKGRVKALTSKFCLSLISFCINSDSWQYRNNSERNGAAFVPIAMPMIC